MLSPKLTNLSEFIDPPKIIVPISTKDIQGSVNWYLNILLFLVLCIGAYILYYRYKYKEYHEDLTRLKIKELDEYLQEHAINDMLSQNNNYNK